MNDATETQTIDRALLVNHSHASEVPIAEHLNQQPNPLIEIDTTMSEAKGEQLRLQDTAKTDHIPTADHKRQADTTIGNDKLPTEIQDEAKRIRFRLVNDTNESGYMTVLPDEHSDDKGNSTESGVQSVELDRSSDCWIEQDDVFTSLADIQQPTASQTAQCPLKDKKNVNVEEIDHSIVKWVEKDGYVEFERIEELHTDQVIQPLPKPTMEAIQLRSNSSRPPPIPKLRKLTVVIDDTDGYHQYQQDYRAIVSGFPLTARTSHVQTFMESNLSTIVTTELLTFDEWTGEAIIKADSNADLTTFIGAFKNHLKPIQFGSNILKARRYPQHIITDSMRVMIHNIATWTTDETIERFLKTRCNLQTSVIVRGERPGAVVAGFTSQPDICRLQDTCKVRACEGKFWKIQTVNQTDRIKIKGYSKSISRDSLALYLKKFVGESVGKMESNPEKRQTIVTLLTQKDIIKITDASIKHELDGQELHISSYYPCLEPCVRTSVTVPEAWIVTDIDPYLARFINENGRYWKELSDQLEGYYATVSWLHNDSPVPIIKIECNVKADDPKLFEKTKEWRNRCTDVLKRVMNKFNVYIIYYIEEIHGDLLQYTKSLDSRDSDTIAHVNDEECRITLVGKLAFASNRFHNIKKKVGELESAFDKLSKPVTQKLKLPDGIVVLVGQQALTEYIMSGADSSVTVKVEGNCIVINGGRHRVKAVHSQAINRLGQLAKKHLSDFGPLQTALVKSQRHSVFDLLDKAIGKRNKTTCIVAISMRREVILYGTNASTLREAESLLRQNILEQTIPVTDVDLRDKDVETLKDKIDNPQLVKSFRMKWVMNQNKVTVAALKNDLPQIMHLVLGCLEDQTIISRFVRLQFGEFDYLQNFCKQELLELVVTHSDVDVELVDDRMRKGFIVRGKRCLCRKFIGCLQDLCSVISSSSITIDNPGYMYLQTEQGREWIEKLQLDQEQQSVIKVKSNREVNQNTPVLRAICSLSKFQVFLYVGCAALMTGDVLVNPSRPDFEHMNGLSGFIVDRGGAVIQDLCRKQYNTNHPFLGAMIHTTAANLDFKSICHVAFPTWTGGNNDEIKLMESIITDCLEDVDATEYKDIVFPSFSSDIFGIPAKAAAKTLFYTIIKYIKDNCTTCNIERFMVCLENEMDVDVFIQELKHHPGDIRFPDKDKVLPSVAKRYITQECLGGPIETKSVDVIVNSTNQKLKLKLGRLSTLILEAAGSAIQDECEENYPDGVGLGQVARTSPGNMKCKAIFHVAIAAWDKGNGFSETVLSTCVWNCLLRSESLGFKSILFPMIGYGNHCIPIKIVYRTIKETVEKFEQTFPFTCLQKVYYLVQPEQESVIPSQMPDANPNREDNPEPMKLLKQDSYLDLKNIDIEKNSCYSILIGHITLSVLEGDITRQTSAIIVNSMSDITNLYTGSVSRAIVKAAGDGIQQECAEPGNVHRFKEHGLVVTEPGLLLCQKIIHMKAQENLQEWKTSIRAVLSKAEEHGYKSVSFPVIGTGVKGCTPEEMAKTFYKALKQYVDNNQHQGHLRKVDIVTFSNPSTMERMVYTIKKCTSTKQPWRPISSFLQPYKATNDESTDVHIYSKSPERVVRLADTLQVELRDQKSKTEQTQRHSLKFN